MFNIQASNPLLSNFTKTTQFAPYIQGSQQAEQIRLGANQTAEQKALNAMNVASGSLTGGVNQALGYRQPYIQTGNQALQRAAGYSGGYDAASLSAMLSNDPVLQAINEASTRAMQTQAANQGMAGSGAFMSDLGRMAQQNSYGYLRNLYDQNLQLAQLGGTAAMNQAADQTQLGRNLADVNQMTGEIGAGAALARGEISANEAINRANAAVAQSSVMGLNQGQTLNSNANALPQVIPGEDMRSYMDRLAASRQLNNQQGQSDPYTDLVNMLKNQAEGGGSAGGGSSGSSGGTTSSGGGTGNQSDADNTELGYTDPAQGGIQRIGRQGAGATSSFRGNDGNEYFMQQDANGKLQIIDAATGMAAAGASGGRLSMSQSALASRFGMKVAKQILDAMKAGQTAGAASQAMASAARPTAGFGSGLVSGANG